jgi:hypothetical protein
LPSVRGDAELCGHTEPGVVVAIDSAHGLVANPVVPGGVRPADAVANPAPPMSR